MCIRDRLAADCMHVFSRIVMGDLEMPRRTKAFQRAKEIIPAVKMCIRDRQRRKSKYRV